ncbi:MAG: hypothetical protein V2I33_19520 [Kangiellaceae bacterium]|jgi:hypothetical protein|nr:hypothetical protein [Kangiellaceae bacterium]
MDNEWGITIESDGLADQPAAPKPVAAATSAMSLEELKASLKSAQNK